MFSANVPIMSASQGGKSTSCSARSPATLEEVGAGAVDGAHGGHGALLPSTGSGSMPFTGSASGLSEDLHLMPGYVETHSAHAIRGRTVLYGSRVES